MNAANITAKPRMTMQQLQIKEQAVFSTIPGMQELLHAAPHRREALQARYPDAAFALMTAENLFTGDREQNIIHQKAYFSILSGETLANIRFRYQRDMDLYVQEHMWD